mgnify:CR=1 FL=1
MGLINIISPAWALKRAQAKAALNIMSGASGDGGGYESASRKRQVFKNWLTSPADAQTDINIGIKDLRHRSRDLEKNNHLAHGALATKLQYVIGGGLQPEPAIDYEFLNLDAAEAETINANIKRVFLKFANDKRGDYRELKDFFEMQADVYHAKNLNGDAWVLLPWIEDKGTPFNTRLHAIEADRICNPGEKKDTEKMRNGLTFDDRGRIKKIHIAPSHPGQGKKQKADQWKTVNFKRANGWLNVLHIANKNNRPGQVTGVPDLTPVMSAIKQMGAYIDAELLGSVISNKFTVFVKSNTPGAANGLQPGGGMMQPGQQTADDYGDEDPLELGDGLVVSLGQDEEIQLANPSRPNPNFGPYIDKLATHIGSALGLPFELLLKHFTASYSASKAALLMFTNWLAVERLAMVRGFCRPVFELIIDEAVASGRLVLPGYLADDDKRAAYLQCAWHGAPIGEIDELKSANAAKVRMESRTTNRSIETRRLGHEVDQVRQGIASEKRKDEAAGLPPVESLAPPDDEPTNQIDKE